MGIFKEKFKVLLTTEGTFHVHENSCQYDTVAEHDWCLPAHCCSHYTACLSRPTLRGVGADRSRPCGLLSFTDLSRRHYDTHNNRLLHHVCLPQCGAALTGSADVIVLGDG